MIGSPQWSLTSWHRRRLNRCWPRIVQLGNSMGAKMRMVTIVVNGMISKQWPLKCPGTSLTPLLLRSLPASSVHSIQFPPRKRSPRDLLLSEFLPVSIYSIYQLSRLPLARVVDNISYSAKVGGPVPASGCILAAVHLPRHFLPSPTSSTCYCCSLSTTQSHLSLTFALHYR